MKALMITVATLLIASAVFAAVKHVPTTDRTQLTYTEAVSNCSYLLKDLQGDISRMEKQTFMFLTLTMNFTEANAFYESNCSNMDISYSSPIYVPTHRK